MSTEQLTATIDAAAWAATLDTSVEACELVAQSEYVDLHIDTFLWSRIFGYDPLVEHGRGIFDARYYGHLDIPRMERAGLGSAFWSITTNAARPAATRPAVFRKNLANLRSIFDKSPKVEHVTNMADYRRVRAEGKHAAWIVVQGGNCFTSVDQIAQIPDRSVALITLVHLSTSPIGTTSAPDVVGRFFRRDSHKGLTQYGRDFVQACDENRILVDLAHIHPDGFWDAVDAHDPSLPLIDSHTGVSGVNLHWRNIDDDQIHAIARTNGVVGIIYACEFLGGRYWGGNDTHRLFDHIAHVVDVAGEDHVALGSDWDGFIVTPRDFPTVMETPRLVQHMLDAGWTHDRIGKVLGGNALRVMDAIRPS